MKKIVPLFILLFLASGIVKAGGPPPPPKLRTLKGNIHLIWGDPKRGNQIPVGNVPGSPATRNPLVVSAVIEGTFVAIAFGETSDPGGILPFNKEVMDGTGILTFSATRVVSNTTYSCKADLPVAEGDQDYGEVECVLDRHTKVRRGTTPQEE